MNRFRNIYLLTVLIAVCLFLIGTAQQTHAANRLMYATDGGPANFYVIDDIGGTALIESFDLDC
jgi:hypothetical protein